MGYKNYYDGSLMVHHYESQTKNESDEKNQMEYFDFATILFPFMSKNWDSIQKFTVLKKY